VIRRDVEPLLEALAAKYPVLTITGPRQAGKTTLCKKAFPRLSYVSLEAHDTREYARSDPRGFLAEYAGGAILDEIQNAPELTSYLQVEVDERPDPGRFVLTGSQHLGLTQAVSQSLAGRTAVIHLLPPSLRELRRFASAPRELLPTLWAGAYPRIHDVGIAADRWLADYVTTYVQRDVRQVINVGDLEAFTAFLRHCAGRSAQEVNLSALGGDVGVSHNTARAWLSVLEATFLCHRIPAWHRNLRKQLVKAPKLHFVDSGLLCHLLGIATPEQLRHHPLRGAIFESWVAAEVFKARAHKGLAASMFHFRDAKGLEVDLVVEASRELLLVEAKSGATLGGDFFAPLQRLAELAAGDEPKPIAQRVVFGGDRGQRRGSARAVPWSSIQSVDWA
jgi:predicted AAA+ superfamily ATPase